MIIQKHKKHKKIGNNVSKDWTYVQGFLNIKFDKNNAEFLTLNLQLDLFPLLFPLFKLFCSFSSIFFQRILFVEIRTLVALLKSTILLKIECQDTHIYMKTKYLQTKWDASF